MKLFEDLPSQNTPFTAEALNQIQHNLVVVSATEPTGDNREKVWFQKSDNLFDKTKITADKYIASGGGFVEQAGVSYSGFVQVVPNSKYYIGDRGAGTNGSWRSVALYDSSLNYVDRITIEIGYYTVPDNIYYMVFNMSNDAVDTFEIYVEPIVCIKNNNDVYEEFTQPEVAISAAKPYKGEKVWIQKGKNLFNPNTDIEYKNAYRAFGDGVVTAIDNYNIFRIEVEPNTTYTASCDLGNGYWHNLCFFDKDMNFISGNIFNTDDRTFTTPSNCKYITIAVHNTYTWFQLEKGSTATVYEEYIEPKIYVKNDNNVYEEFISKEILDVYSAGETKIGTWIDGKPLYRKIISDIVPATTSGTVATKEISLEDNIDFCMIEFAYFEIYGTQRRMCPFILSGTEHVNVYCLIDTNKLMIRSTFQDASNYPIKIAIMYTKTTD